MTSEAMTMTSPTRLDGAISDVIDGARLDGATDDDLDDLPFGKTLGQRLRAIRSQQGLSLQGVEQKSGGRWKAVVVGSYERGDRAVTVARLAELAAFYNVPLSELLPSAPAVTTTSQAPAGSRVVIDLQRLHRLPQRAAAPLARYAAAIQSQRGDYNGRVLSIRTEDLRSLSVIYDQQPDELCHEWASWGVLTGSAS